MWGAFVYSTLPTLSTSVTYNGICYQTFDKIDNTTVDRRDKIRYMV